MTTLNKETIRDVGNPSKFVRAGVLIDFFSNGINHADRAEELGLEEPDDAGKLYRWASGKMMVVEGGSLGLGIEGGDPNRTDTVQQIQSIAGGSGIEIVDGLDSLS